MSPPPSPVRAARAEADPLAPRWQVLLGIGASALWKSLSPSPPPAAPPPAAAAAPAWYVMRLQTDAAGPPELGGVVLINVTRR